LEFRIKKGKGKRKGKEGEGEGGAEGEGESIGREGREEMGSPVRILGNFSETFTRDHV
jgi:hypothetical protein